MWARWRGPLGLVWLQRQEPAGAAAGGDARRGGVKEQALRLFARDAPLGAKPLIDARRGLGVPRAARNSRPGMDLGDIDWKQSARHGKLIGREYRTERNHHILLALDTGRLMSAPTAGAAAHRPGDQRGPAAGLRVRCGWATGWALFAFDAKPRLASGLVVGAGRRSRCCRSWRRGSTTRPRRPTSPWA